MKSIGKATLLSVPVIALVSCSLLASQLPQTPAPIPRAAVSTTSTSTPSPAPSATPTLTPYPPLQTTGPYLLFTHDQKHFTLMDADGGGLKQIELPGDGSISQLHRSISPDGTRLVYFTGSREQPYDIALNVLDLSNETTQLISNLLAPEFPANLDPLLETMILGDPLMYYTDCFEDLECRRDIVRDELVNSLSSFDWSPDSQSIAFTAQIDGPSSDIYIYHIPDKTIRRLTNEPQNIYWLDWAPNGLGMLYQISSPVGTNYEGSEWHLISLEGKEMAIAEQLAHDYFRWGGHDWISENLYLFLNWSDAPPHHSRFKTLNTDTGQVKEIWPYSADFFAVDHENDALYLSFRHDHEQSSAPAEGIYIIDTNGNFRRVIDANHILFSFAERRGPYQVLGVDYEGRVYDIRYDGSQEILKWNGDPFPALSPDGKLLFDSEYKELVLYNDSYEPLKSWPMEEDGYTIVWSPDSAGAFLFTETRVSFLEVSGGRRTLLEDCSGVSCKIPQFVWLP